MLCCICKEKEATVHLTQIEGETMHKVDLCEECAKQKGVNDPTGFSLADLLLGLGVAQDMEKATGGADVKCPNCGHTQADFKKTGRFGCSECYTVFAEGLEGLLKTMHKDVRHIGKAPKARRQIRERQQALKTLQTELALAIEAEKFEDAARLRDELKRLQNAAIPVARA
jgi:protein arginine kinase activator